MAVFSFHLRVTPHAPLVFLRELNGHDELLIDGSDTATVLRLLNNIIVSHPRPDAARVVAEKISISDRDYLLTCIYKYSYGPRIESLLNCVSCNERFDINFLLDDLIVHSKDQMAIQEPDHEGFFFSKKGVRFRLPAGEDELAVYGLPPEKAGQLMLKRCLGDQQPQTDTTDLLTTMEELAPLLVINTETNCPECGQPQPVRFDIQSYLLAKMKNEKKRVAAEVHCIASAYHWSHKEILDLPRSLRSAYAKMIGLN